MEAIILSGGKGIRLKEKIKNIPKTMASIKGKPLLEITLDYLEQFSIKDVILAVGYKKEYIKRYFGNKYKSINIIYSEEKKALDTGGAIKQAINRCKEENILVMNGDIYAKIDITEMLENHKKNNNDITIAIKEMKNVDRFGIVQIIDNKVMSFEEKKFMEKANISIGCYIVKRNIFENKIDSKVFSMEKDYLEKFANQDKIGCFIYDDVFVDIGIPEDYDKLSREIAF